MIDYLQGYYSQFREKNDARYFQNDNYFYQVYSYDETGMPYLLSRNGFAQEEEAKIQIDDDLKLLKRHPEYFTPGVYRLYVIAPNSKIVSKAIVEIEKGAPAKIFNRCRLD